MCLEVALNIIGEVVEKINRENEKNEIIVEAIKCTMEKICSTQYYAAINCLQDTKLSKNPKREIESAITQLRLVIESSDDNLFKCETHILIAICYRNLSENQLAGEYIKRAEKEFEEYRNNVLKQLNLSIWDYLSFVVPAFGMTRFVLKGLKWKSELLNLKSNEAVFKNICNCIVA